MTEPIWLQQAFPWLGRGFVHAVAETYADEFIRDLENLGFTVATMSPTSPDEFHEHMAAALGFPSYYGKNWDAAHDSFRDFEPGRNFALVWRKADEIARRDPKLFAEAASVLTREFEEFETLGHGNVQAVLVLTGDGAAFRRPEDRVARRPD